MPLIHGKSKKAFSENVATEMEHGKPQKQALAIAYDVMRKAGHKMAKGGMCEKCGDQCKYSDGGAVAKLTPSPYDKAGSDISSSISSDKAKSMADAFKAHGGKIEKRINDPKNKPGGYVPTGFGSVGVHDSVEKFGKNKGKSTGHVSGGEFAKDRHAQKLNELKSMPNPNLKGLSHGGHVSGFDLNDQAVAKWMQEGKHTMAEGGEVEEMEHLEGAEDELLEQCADELINAMEQKDKKGMLEAIKAIVISLKG